VIPTTEHETQILAYTVGEDVVVRLAGVDVLDVEHMVVVPPTMLPEWTIARIVSFVVRDDCLCYVVSGEVRDASCMCVVDDDAIEGIA
jgi:hypothetical protein